MKILNSLSRHLLILLLFILFERINIIYVSAEGGYPSSFKVSSSQENRIIFANLRQPLELKCPGEELYITNLRNYIDWHKGDLDLYYEGYTITKRGTVKIKSVSRKHAGTYRCTIINAIGMNKESSLTVIVIDSEMENENSTHPYRNSAIRVQGVPPTIKKRPTTSAYQELGEQATFHCMASAQPAPDVFWVKDGVVMQDVETTISNELVHSTLRIRKLQKSDAGTYKCIARNKIGTDEMDFILRVSEPASPPEILSFDPLNASIKEGSTAVFWCKVKSKSGLKLHIKWLKRLNTKTDEEPINDATLFRAGTTYYRPLNLSDGVRENGIYQSKLVVQNTKKEDSGIYICLALNDKGFITVNGTLNIIATENSVNSFRRTDSSLVRSDTSLKTTHIMIAILIIVIVLLLIFGMLLTFYCRKKTPNTAISNEFKSNFDIEKQDQISTLLKKQERKGVGFVQRH